MHKRIIAIALLGFLVLAALVAFNNYTASSARPLPSANAVSAKKTASTISAEGRVVPSQRTALAFKMGGRVVDILVHEGDAVKAGAVLARLDDTLLKGQIAQAQATLKVAQQQLAQLRAGGTPAERQAARDAIAAARGQYGRIKVGPTADEVALLKANMDSAQAALAQAQFRYDRIGGDANPFGRAAPEALALEQAFINLEAAQAAYRNALSHPTPSELQLAQAAITQAESVLARLDASAEAIALAQAQVDQAQAALDLAKAADQDAEIAAPFDGTVAAITIDVGQVVGPGTPAITFGNLAELRIETTDLAEADVARVTANQPVKITLEALPEQVLTGRVANIAPIANDHRGDQVFKVTIDGFDSDRLRWGMTTNVDINLGP